MLYVCIRCKRSFTNPAWLKRHERRKTPCAPIIEPQPTANAQGDTGKVTCKYCNRTYSSNAALLRHIRETCKIAPNKKNGNVGMEHLYEHTLQKQNEAIAIQHQQQQIDELKAQNTEILTLMRQIAGNSTAGNSTAIELCPTPTPSATQITVDIGAVTNTTLAAGENGLIQCDRTNIATDKSVAFNLFGQESLTHVTSDRVRDILDESLRLSGSIQAAALMAVTKTAMLIYSDPDHPENLTCYMPNKKTNDVLTHTKRGWEIYPVAMVINQIGQKTIDHIFEKQPHENANHYTLIMKELQKNEQAYIIDAIVRPILIRNRSLLGQATETLPVAGTL